VDATLVKIIDFKSAAGPQVFTEGRGAVN
jgi:hypothetical protein